MDNISLTTQLIADIFQRTIDMILWFVLLVFEYICIYTHTYTYMCIHTWCYTLLGFSPEETFTPWRFRVSLSCFGWPDGPGRACSLVCSWQWVIIHMHLLWWTNRKTLQSDIHAIYVTPGNFFIAFPHVSSFLNTFCKTYFTVRPRHMSLQSHICNSSEWHIWYMR